MATGLTKDIDKVRMKIGDTDEDSPLLTDQEIQTELTNWPDNLDLAAANCAEAIAAAYSREFSFQTDGQQFELSARVSQYMSLAAQLRSRGALLEMPPGRVSTFGSADSLYGTA